MSRIYWLPLGLAAVLAGLPVQACSLERSCQTTHTCRGVKAGSGGGGDAGSDDATGEAGSVAGSGGTAGRAVSDGEQAGSAGEGGAPGIFATLFDACSVKGAFACVELASAQRLACDGKTWQAGTTCGAFERCDSSNGKCLPMVTECISSAPGAVVCRNDTVLSCGPDLVTASARSVCDGRCKSGVCQAPTCGDDKVEAGEDCDDAAANASGACAKCKTPSCGDGVLYTGHEQCDDGNRVSGDGCSASCTAEPVELALGNAVTCVRSSLGSVKCWGYNGTGQLGLGDTANRGGTTNTVPSKLPAIDLGAGRKAIAISARGSSVCALLDNADLKCWGNNYWGQLGTGDADARGDDPDEMGDALKPIPLGSGLTAIGLSAGESHTCALLAGGGVKCWGSKEYGQLGQDNKQNAPSPKELPSIQFARPAVAVSASNFLFNGKGGENGGSTCALLDDGSARCWGSTDGVTHAASADLDSSYGIGDAPSEMSALATLTFGGSPAKSILAGTVSAVVLSDGSLRLWGTGAQLGQPALGSAQIGMSPASLAGLSAVQTGGKKVKSFAIGLDHACAVFDGGVLKCWGNGSEGQLGLGSTLATTTAPSEISAVGLGGRTAQQVAAGKHHTCAILDDGALRCWGDNDSGQLGLGHSNDKSTADSAVDLSF